MIKPEHVIVPSILPWIDSAFESMSFTRSNQEEGLLVWVNMVTCGIVPVMKRTYILQLVTGILAAVMQNGVAVIIQANRAADVRTSSSPLLFTVQHVYPTTSTYNLQKHIMLLLHSSCFIPQVVLFHSSATMRKSKKEEKDESDDEDEPMKEEDDGTGPKEEDDEEQPSLGVTSALSDWQHAFESELRQPGRNLAVKDLVIAFDPSTIYAQRTAYMKGLVVTVACAIPGSQLAGNQVPDSQPAGLSAIHCIPSGQLAGMLATHHIILCFVEIISSR